MRFGLVLLIALLVPRALTAQGVGAATDIITGTITTADGPVPDANVEAYSLETQVTRRARTDARGRFTILFPDGGGQYRMAVRAIGMTPRIEVIQRHADEDRLVWNVRLAAGVVALDEITVRGGPPQLIRAPDGPTPGSTERALGIEQVSRLPIDQNDLAALAGLAPGVLTISGTDTTATAFSVAGLGPDANALTLDGLLFGNASIPQEGLRQTRVVTSTYDVSRGQFSGGLIASTTRSGSNVVQGSSQYQLREDDLAVSDDDSPFAQGFTQHVLSGGLGGPLVRDRLFLFGAVQARLRSDPQQTLLSARTADYGRLGVHPDSVARFLAIVNALGVPPASVPGSSTRSNDNVSGLARLDFVLSNEHTVTLRGDWRGTSQDPTRLGSLALPQTGGLLKSGGGGVMATLTSRLGATIINELRGYVQTSFSDGDPYSALPSGRVQIASNLPDGTLGVSTLTFGGNAGLPSRNDARSIEATNELSWLPGRGAHRVKLGASLVREQSTSVVGTNQYGTFVYNSLADLEGDRPASFRRTVVVTERESRSDRWALYAGDVWMVTRPFQLTYGVRVEGSAFGAPPPSNGAVDTAFGRRTDRLPREWHASPRAGFSWTIGQRPGGGPGGPGGGFQFGGFSPPTLVIRGGVGEFRNQPPAGLVAQARSATGLTQSQAEIFCAGPASPTPAWDAYWADAATIPTQCAGPAGPGGFRASRTVMLLASGFDAPRAWRGSLAVEKRLTQLFRLSIEGSITRGVAQTGFRDLNLGAPRFSLGSEAGRPVFVAAADIDTSSGVARFNGSRTDSAFGQVIEAYSSLRNRSEQLTVSLGGILGRGIMLNASWTMQWARDQQSGIRGGNTAADPNAAEWAPGGFGRRHNVLTTVTYPLSQSVELTGIGRLTSGAPFTPMVGGDVNGDGSRNDRAFIPVAGGGSPEAAGLANLLAQAPGNVRSCLERQAGRIAARNSCTGPWQYSLDFQMNWRPAFLGLNRRLTVSLVTQNFLRGLDELLHREPRGWGIVTQPDNTLLYVGGFDAAAGRFRYTVNERFGATAGTATAFRPPFQLGLQVRLSIGPDRVRQALDAMRSGGRGGQVLTGVGGFRGPAVNATELVARIEAALPNPARAALDLRDSLRLEPGQIALLTPLADSVAAANALRIDSLRRLFGEGDATPQRLMQAMPAMRPLFEAARNEIQRAMTTVRAILTAEQWDRLPEQVRNVPLGPRMLLGPGGNQQPGRPRP